ncbi:glycosyltransferase family 2 protein [Gaoshiqia sp. Z1-71]|uniref:glycosyltransferase family 2 protein n=1 Tax=Gaoshiqia hydrogeniformans TaxID=3290090 RepID=UPI003BF83DD3
MKISLVIPIYNEEGLIDELIGRSVKSLSEFTDSFEIVVVDDGSADGSLAKLIGHQQADRHIKVVSLSRNFGHQPAFTAGLEYTKGDYVAMMDGDLQDPPELLFQMYRKLSEGRFDIVSGKRMARKGNRTKNMVTSMFHILFKKMTRMDDLENAGNFSMMNRQALTALLSLEERVRYLPGLRTFIGFRQGFVEYVREDRLQGEPKMNMRKLLVLAADAIFSFSRLPIRICLVLGLVGTIVFMLAGFYVLISKVLGYAILGWSSTVLSIYFLGSIQLIFLGVVGEYVYRIYKESQKRPLYFIKKIYENEEEA